MGKIENIQRDIEVFIEYQQVLKESDIINNKDAKAQVYEIYEEMLSTKEAKHLMKEHFAFKNSTINLSTERSFLVKNLEPLITQTPENTSLRRGGHMTPGALPNKIKEETKDLATSLTTSEIHPFIKNHPEKQKHALGVLTRVAGLRQEHNLSLSTQITEIKTKLSNAIGNLLNQGNTQQSIQDLLDKTPEKQKQIVNQNEIKTAPNKEIER